MGRAAAGGSEGPQPVSDRRRRVLLVLASSEGGVVRHVSSLAVRLRRMGRDVMVAGPAATLARLDGGTGLPDVPTAVVEISASPHPGRDLSAASALRRLVGTADVVHAHGLRAGVVAVLAVRSVHRRPSLVVTWHNAVLGTGLKRRVLALVEALVARGADITLGASADLVQRALALGARDVRLGEVAAPGRSALVRRSSPRATLAAELSIDPTALWVLSVGRIAPQKDQHLLLDAAAALRARDIDVVVLLAGGGDPALTAALTSRVAQEHLPVVLLGARDDVPDLLAAADVFALPSRWEARALVVQEAMAAGLPVVASDVGGLPDLLAGAGTLVPAGDAGALADALARYAEEPAARVRDGAAAAARAATFPDEDDVARLVDAVHRAALRP